VSQPRQVQAGAGQYVTCGITKESYQSGSGADSLRLVTLLPQLDLLLYTCYP
jgi:hypothetical protein